MVIGSQSFAASFYFYFQSSSIIVYTFSILLNFSINLRGSEDMDKALGTWPVLSN